MSTSLDDIVQAYCSGFILKDHQRHVFKYLLDKKGDLLLSLPVGYGKSLLYHLLPQILGNVDSPAVCLAISPLNIIQKDQVEALKLHNISTCRLNILCNVVDTTDTTCTDDIHFDDFERLKKGDFSIVLVQPEALFNTPTGNGLLSDEQFVQRVVAVVVDECHILEKWLVYITFNFNVEQHHIMICMITMNIICCVNNITYNIYHTQHACPG